MSVAEQANALCASLASATSAAERFAAHVRERLELAELQLEVDLWILAGEWVRQFQWVVAEPGNGDWRTHVGYTWVAVTDTAWPPRAKESLCPCGGSDLAVGELRYVGPRHHTAPAVCYGCGQLWIYVADLGTHAGARLLARRTTEADVANIHLAESLEANRG